MVDEQTVTIVFLTTSINISPLVCVEDAKEAELLVDALEIGEGTYGAFSVTVPIKTIEKNEAGEYLWEVELWFDDNNDIVDATIDLIVSSEERPFLEHCEECSHPIEPGLGYMKTEDNETGFKEITVFGRLWAKTALDAEIKTIEWFKNNPYAGELDGQ